MKFIFDTGASNVCLSMSMAEYLYDNDYITDEDIVGVGTSSVADGRIVDHIKINLRDIEIGNQHINNVEAVVIEGQNAPLLMGQSALKKLGRIEISGDVLTIRNEYGDSQEEQIRNINLELAKAMSNGLHDKALECFELLYNINALSDDDLYNYANLLNTYEKPREALNVLNKINDIQETIKYWDVYNLYAQIYYSLEDFNKAIHYNNLSIEKVEHTWRDMMLIYWLSALCYASLENYDKASDYFWEAFCSYAEDVDIAPTELWFQCKSTDRSPYRTDRVDSLAYFYLTYCKLSHKIDENDYYDELSTFARAGNKQAIIKLNQIGKRY